MYNYIYNPCIIKIQIKKYTKFNIKYIIHADTNGYRYNYQPNSNNFIFKFFGDIMYVDKALVPQNRICFILFTDILLGYLFLKSNIALI